MSQQTRPQNILEQRAAEKQRVQKKMRLVFIIGLLLLFLLTIIGIASSQPGGITQLFQGDSDPITNGLKNIGTTFTGNTGEANTTPIPTPTSRIVEFPKPLSEQGKATTSGIPGLIILTAGGGGEYKQEIKKGGFIKFQNSTGNFIILRFSNGRELGITNNDEESITFINPGTYTFEDKVDKSQFRIKGTIVVNN